MRLLRTLRRFLCSRPERLFLAEPFPNLETKLTLLMFSAVTIGGISLYCWRGTYGRIPSYLVCPVGAAFLIRFGHVGCDSWNTPITRAAELSLALELLHLSLSSLRRNFVGNG